MRRKIVPYQSYLKEYARKLRNNSTRSEIYLWKNIKGRRMCGYDFHRQKPLLNYIADFYCHELKLVIELDGYTHEFEEVIKKDIIKQEALEEIGLTVLRFKDEEVLGDIHEVLSAIEEYVVSFEEE